MEFHEKLQKLRKDKGLTQEELAEILYVSRTAVSKWESGRGYPSIDSLKDIAAYFQVSLDDLLSTEKIISIAQNETKENITYVYHHVFGIIDLFVILLVVLPLYPVQLKGYVYSVNLFDYDHVSTWIVFVHWIVYLSLIITGIIKFIFINTKYNIYQKFTTYISFIINIIMVVFLSLTRETYAILIAFMLLLIKGILLLKSARQ